MIIPSYTLALTCNLCRGHNELDNPSLTQPLMYKIIDSKTSVPDSFAQEMEVHDYACNLCIYPYTINIGCWCGDKRATFRSG